MTRGTQSLPQAERRGEEPTKGITAASLVELLQFRAQAQPNSLAFSFLRDGEIESESLTFAELDKRARAIAVSLQWLQSSKTQGEGAVLLYPAGLEYICAFFGCLYANAIAVPVYPPRFNHNVSRLEAIIEDARPAIALTNAAVYQRMERLKRFSL